MYRYNALTGKFDIVDSQDAIRSLNSGFSIASHCVLHPDKYGENNLANSEFNNINGRTNTLAEHPGQWRMRLLNDPNARAVFQIAQSSGVRDLVFGGGSWTVEATLNIGVLSNASDEYAVIAGLVDGRANDSIADGVYWEYDRTNSVNWIGVTEASSTRTEVDSGTVVASGDSDWVKLRFEVNSDGSQVDFYLDDVLVGSSITNITSNGMQFMIRAMKSASTTSINALYIDSWGLANSLT